MTCTAISKICGSRRGTTLLELMIVVIIVGILSVTVIHYYQANLESARRTRLLSDMQAIREACKKFAISSQGVYPEKIAQLEGAYFKTLPKSPYGTNYELDPVRGEVVCRYTENNAVKVERMRYRPE